MNLAGQAGDDQSELLFVNFNQDWTSLAVGTKSGYKLFSLSSVEKLDQIYDNESDDICIVERLFSSSLVAIVSLSSPRKLKVCHFKKGTEICNYSYSNSILAVKLNRQRLIVCLEESLYIHNIRDMKVLHTIRDTPPNPTGLCALSINNDNCFLAYPGSNQIGEVQIFDTINLRAVTMIPAHDNPLAAIAFNAQGTKIATASEKGTVIRVFSTPDGQKLFEFRRGMKRCVHIFSLAFSSDSMYLSASSNTETVHIFKLETHKESRPQEDGSSWMGYFNQALKTSANYLPAQVTDMFNQGRAFAICKLPSQGLKNVCAIATEPQVMARIESLWLMQVVRSDKLSNTKEFAETLQFCRIQKVPRLLVASQDGYLYIYNLDPNDGGECMLLRQHSLDGRQCEGHLSDLSSGNSDRPLTSTSVPVTYAGSVKRVEPIIDGTPPLATGKHVSSVGVTTGQCSPPAPSTSPLRLESFATVLQLGKGGPQEVGVDYGHSGVSEIDIILAGRDSQPFQEFEQGATGQELGPGAGLNALRLDDDNEFPPMTHKVD